MWMCIFMYRKKFKLCLALTTLFILLTGCSRTYLALQKSTRYKAHEYFSETKYKTKASPRIKRSSNEIRAHTGNYIKFGRPYKVKNRWYYPKKTYAHYKQTGKASWYGAAFQGRLTANGEVYNMNGLSAAHPTMPLPSYARVTNLSNGSSIIVRVNDRGPYVANRIIDLSREAAKMLNYKDNGLASVKVEYIGLAPLKGDDSKYLLASYKSGSKGKSNSIFIAKTKSNKDDKNNLASIPSNESLLSINDI